MEGHRREQDEETQRIRRPARYGVHSDHRLHEQVSGHQEVHDHPGVPDVIRGRPAEQRRVVEDPERTGEEHRGNDRIGQDAGDARVHGEHDPLARTAAPVRSLGDRAESERDRSGGRQQHGDHHGQHHVPEHVRAEEVLLVRVDTAIGHVEEQREAGEPEHDAIPGPGISAFVEAPHSGEIEEGQKGDDQNPEQVESPDREVAGKGQFGRKRLAREDVGGGRGDSRL